MEARDHEKRNKLGRTELHIAVCKGDIVHTEQLLRNRASLDAKDRSGWTPLHLAAQFDGRIELVRMLLQAKAPTETTDVSGYTPRDLACISKLPEVMLLLQNTADCPGCGHRYVADAMFCHHCGRKRTEEESTAENSSSGGLGSSVVAKDKRLKEVTEPADCQLVNDDLKAVLETVLRGLLGQEVARQKVKEGIKDQLSSSSSKEDDLQILLDDLTAQSFANAEAQKQVKTLLDSLTEPTTGDEKREDVAKDLQELKTMVNNLQEVLKQTGELHQAYVRGTPESIEPEPMIHTVAPHVVRRNENVTPTANAENAADQEYRSAQGASSSSQVKDECDLYFTVRGKPAVLDRKVDVSFFGHIKKERGCDCIVSFPGKFKSGWEALTNSRHVHSVACVFLCTEEDGIGQHYSEQGSDLCMCHTIYGERSFEEFGYLKILAATCSNEEVELEREKAKPTKTIVIQANASAEEKRKAEGDAKRAWEANGKAASWGCFWFKRWKERIEEALRLEQRLKVVFYPGQVDEGVVLWDELKTAKLWDNKGCGGSQKAEIAYLNKNKIHYDSVDVSHFLKQEFKLGAKVDAFDGQFWRKGTLLEVPKIIQDKTSIARWCVRSETGEIFETDRMRHANLISDLLADVGKEEFVRFATAPLKKELEVKKTEEVIFPDGTPALAIRLHVESIEILQYVRDVVLNFDLEAFVNSELLKKHRGWQVQLDKTYFCEVFEKQLMRFSQLTPHQESRLKSVEGMFRHGPVHLSAPAGAGKTFVAIQCACNVIKSTEGQILFAAPSVGLGYYFVRWLAQRCDDLPLDTLLERVVLIHGPDSSFMMLCIDGGRLRSTPVPYSKLHFSLAIVDEAHDFFGSKDYDKFFKERVKTQRVLLLSSKSQASVAEFSFPDANEVKLTQIVRSTKRIVAGAAAFQGSPEEKDGVHSLCPAGPPLKTFLFKADQANEVDYAQYAAKTFAAISDTMRAYTDLSFHRRVTLLVPDRQFLDEFKKHFLPYLHLHVNARRIETTSFRDCLTILSNHKAESNVEMIILDTVQNAKGLESLIVVCIGLDQKLRDRSTNLATRSLIYQAISRAQLQAVVVNHHVQGGWLEFLGLISFEEKQYHASSAMAETSTEAANQSIYGALPAAVAGGRASEKKPSDTEPKGASDDSIERFRSSSVRAWFSCFRLRLRSKEHSPELHKEVVPAPEASKVQVQTKSQVWNTENNDEITINFLGFDPRACAPGRTSGDSSGDSEEVAPPRRNFRSSAPARLSTIKKWDF